MKPHLLYPDSDFDTSAELPRHEHELTQDLGLDALFAAMGDGDDFLTDIARRVVLTTLDSAEVVTYRQRVLSDCLQHPDVVQQIYNLAVEAITAEKKIWRGVRQPDSILHSSIQAMQVFVDVLRRLRHLCDQRLADFQSDGIRQLFTTVQRELDDSYFEKVDDHLKHLQFRGGALLSATLGTGNKGSRYTLRAPNPPTGGRLKRLTGPKQRSETIRIPARDEAGYRAVGELRARAINLAANAVAQSADHILAFFTMLRRELGFYLGCIHLRHQLEESAAPVCMPQLTATAEPSMTCTDLYDVVLSLRTHSRPVGNTINATDTRLVVITGANQGGKSTFLRSVGLAQLMAQSGMFTPASTFTATLHRQVFTHYKREEDSEMNSGKLDEELARMSGLADALSAGCLVLFNESFASTNEREGAEISRQIIRALTEAGITVYFVTHLYDLAHDLYASHAQDCLFLRAERRDDTTRTFRVTEGEPLPTSYGQDVYEQVFGETSDDNGRAGRTPPHVRPSHRQAD